MATQKKIKKWILIAIFGGALILAIAITLNWSHIINLMMPQDNRPEPITYSAESTTQQQLDTLGTMLKNSHPGIAFRHIQQFKEAGISQYEGPQTCLTCHSSLTYTDIQTGTKKQTNLMENLLSSAHYRFFSTSHPNVWGFNGELADDFPMGKIDRPCPKPGSFAFTAWAEIVRLKDGSELSEGCGQCHIGGQYQPPLGELMPGYQTLQVEKDAIDCLICHAIGYDMNKKQVVEDANGRTRWDQDRSMKAALSVTTPTAQNCLRCHQHNFGGDIYVDPLDPTYMQSMIETGTTRPRVLHPGSKRGTPYSPTWDVHARAGVNCIQCHVTEGHHIAKGTHTTTMMANDLPQVEITCTKCHSQEPHKKNPNVSGMLNMHIQKIACQTCHIPSLHPDSTTFRDFSETEYEDQSGIYVYHDIKKDPNPGEGITYVWWNGDATFLGNPIGDNPNNADLYRFYKLQHKWKEFEEYDYKTWYETVMRPIAKKKPSKLYAMKVYNGKQHIDLQNMGPFGGMFVPYNLPTYYTTGNPDKAAQTEMKKSMMGMMYGFMFKVYLMDKFMSFMAVDSWDTGAYDEVLQLQKVEPRWIPTHASMEISHAIRLEGALTCARCHGSEGVLNWNDLGYTEEEIKRFTSINYEVFSPDQSEATIHKTTDEPTMENKGHE